MCVCLNQGERSFVVGKEDSESLELILEKVNDSKISGRLDCTTNYFRDHSCQQWFTFEHLYYIFRGKSIQEAEVGWRR